jgi:HSP20 family protein
MTFYYYSPFPPRRHQRMERMMREMRPEGGPCCDEQFQAGVGHEGHRRYGFPIPVDVESREEAFVISAMLPGLKPEDVEIQIEKEVVTISGELKLDEDEKTTWLLRERPRGHFSRSLELPAGLDAEKAKAGFENGILTLTIPKSPEARPKTIKVNVK